MLTTSVLAILLQVGPNPTTGALPDAHSDLRDRPVREQLDDTIRPESEWLAQCLQLLSQDASRAHTMAQVRRNASAGTERVLANHCLGLAATELGRWDEAQAAFSAAREETPADEASARARFGTMAGNAALAQGDTEAALAILNVARSDARTSASATLEAIAATDTARALVAAGREEEALEQLATATRLEPANPEGWLLTATLLRRLDRLGQAQEAIERAAALDTQDPRIALEGGVIAVLSGRDDAARASWESVIDLAPESEAAASARGYLAQLGAAPETASEPQEPS